MHESIVCSTHSQSQEVILEKLLKAQEVMEILAIGKSLQQTVLFEDFEDGNYEGWTRKQL